MIDQDGLETTYRYDLASRLVETVLPNQVIERRDYDNLNRLTHLSTVRRDEVTGEETLITSFEYSLNKIGHRLQVTESTGRVVSYEYDQLYRLTKESISDPNDPTNDGRVTEYELDALGNRLRRIDSLEGETTYTYNQNNQLLTEIRRQGDVIEQEIAYNYNDNGNLLSKTVNDTDVTTYRWNDQNRLVQVELPNGDSISFVYDTAGIQVSRTLDGETTTFIIDSNRPYAQVIESLDDETLLEFKTFGIDLISQSDENGTIYFHTDGLGSTRAITDANGEVQDRFNYNAFGELLTIENNSDVDNLFTGEQYDAELGLQYLRQRYYDPSTGRFISQDPFEGFLDDPITQNRFLYGNANPVTYTDPSGYVSISELQETIKGIGILAKTALSSNVGRVVFGASLGVFNNVLGKVANGDDISVPELLLAAGTGALLGNLAPTIAAKVPKLVIVGISAASALSSLETLHEALNDPNSTAIRKTAALLQAAISLVSLQQTIAGLIPGDPGSEEGLSNGGVDPSDGAEGANSESLLPNSAGTDNGDSPFSELSRGPISSSDVNINDLMDAANRPLGRGGLTKAGRGLDKHANGQRGNSPFPALSGSNQQKNQVANQQLNDILNSPNAEFKKLGRGGIQARLPDGRGVRFNSDGSFSGFID